MKNRALLACLIVCASCYVELDVQKIYFFGNDTAATWTATPVTFSGNFTFTTDLFLLMGSSRTNDLAMPLKEDVHIEGQGTYTVVGVDDVTLAPRPVGATLVLIDQSGTYDSADALNYRSKLLNQFLHELNNGSSFLLGGFTKNGMLSEEPVETSTTDFISDADAIVPYLFSMPARTGGESPLYDALLNGVARLSTVASPRYLLVLAHNPDAGSIATIDQVIFQANANNIRIDIIYVGKTEDAQPLSRISTQTSGLFAFCPTHMEMITTFNHLNRIYNQGATLLRIHVTFTSAAPLGSGVDTFHSITIHDPYEDVDLNPALVVVRTP